MGHKVHPLGLRLGITKKWKSNWFSRKKVKEYLLEDQKIRRLIKERYKGAGIAEVSIERPTEERTSLVIRVARPGIIIGRGGEEIDRFNKELEELTKRKVKISIKEVENPELEGVLVAEDVAFRLENRIPTVRAMKEVIQRVRERGAKGVKIKCSGRLGGAEIARSIWHKDGRVPTQTLRADIDYGFAEAWTKYGKIGVKVWVYRGDILPPRGDGHASAGTEVHKV